MDISKGYDAVKVGREEDDLDRWRFAAEIVEVVLATPSDWSVRIGIFGRWGEGKSTVLRFAEDMLKQKENIVFAFSPWAIQDWDDLWEEFGNRLLEALTAAKVPFEGYWKKKVKDSGKFLKSKGVDKVAQGTLTVLGKEKLYDATFGVVSKWLRYDGPQIQAIRSKLKDRRLVVLIDDLDRCAPELLPRLLLSLRELLDLPGFSFLLAFDDEIVANSLTKTNPAWTSGSTFLEKILDFHFHLPPITELQKQRLVNRAIARYCAFVPKDSAKEVSDLLPDNPRKLKSLIRSMTALKLQVLRHDPDELNWVDMWLAQLLRLESYPFFERLLKREDLEKVAGQLYRIEGKMSRHTSGAEDEDKNKRLKEIITEAGVNDPTLTQRLIHIVEAARARSSIRFRYICELAIRPHAVTWKEFREFYALWSADRRMLTLSNWIEHHAKARDISIDDVEEELFDTTLKRRNECLSAAAESASITEHDSFIDEAGNLLQLMEQDLLDFGKLSAARLSKLYGQTSYWIGFRKNPSDKVMRDQEEVLLLKLLSSTSEGLSTEILEVITPKHFYPELDEGAPERESLRSKCVEIVAPKAARVAISFMTKEGGIQSLLERDRFPAVKYCLFNPESSIWTTSLCDDLVALIRRGREDSIIYDNVYALFNLLLQGLDRGVDFISRQNIKALLSNGAFTQSLWETVTSRGIQYRMQISFLRARQFFLQIGVPEAALPLTEELQSRSKEVASTSIQTQEEA
jgi:KAP family P-loop domain